MSSEQTLIQRNSIIDTQWCAFNFLLPYKLSAVSKKENENNTKINQKIAFAFHKSSDFYVFILISEYFIRDIRSYKA